MHRDPDRSVTFRIPDWLIGLVLAILVVAAGFAYLRSIGAGDDPAFESEGSEPETVTTALVMEMEADDVIVMNVLSGGHPTAERMVPGSTSTA